MQTMFRAKNDIQQFPSYLRALIESELEGGERIDWAGKPVPALFAFRSVPILLFAIPWTAFSLFWIAGASGFEVPSFKETADFFPLFGLPFLLIGLAMLSAPLLGLRNAKKTAYVLTNKRAIIFAGGFSTTIRSFDSTRLRDLRRKQRANGTGDLIFERRLSLDADGDRQTTDHGFLAIANVKEVEGMVRKLVGSTEKTRA